MTGYRLTAAGARHYPGIDPRRDYEAVGEPDKLGGVFLHVPVGKNPRYVWVVDFEEVGQDPGGGNREGA